VLDRARWKTWVIAPDGSGLRPLTAPGLPNAGAWSSGPRLARAVRRLPALPTVQVSWTSGQVKVKPSGTAGFRILRSPNITAPARASTHVTVRASHGLRRSLALAAAG
jgi:hypothetical protein